MAIKDEGEVTRSLMRARCDRGAEIALLIGLTSETAEAIRALDEHWDGGGQPRGLRGEEIPLLARILCLAQTVEIFQATGASRRPGTWPGSAAGAGSTRSSSTRSARACDDAAFCESLGDDDVSAWEPEDRAAARRQRPPRHDRDCVRRRDRRQVALDLPALRPRERIAASLASVLGADADALSHVRRAALLHDIGKLAISNRILDKPAPLTAAEAALVREHPLFTAQILERIPGFRELAPVASAHHERLDGGGYPRGLTGHDLDMPMRVLAVADVYEAVTSERPYRAAMSSDQALAILRAEVPAQLDAAAVAALGDLLGQHAGFDDAHRAAAVLDHG